MRWLALFAACFLWTSSKAHAQFFDPKVLDELVAKIVPFGPPKDCKTATGVAEKTICGSPNLRDADLKADEKWAETVSDGQKEAAIAQRRQWRERLRADCELKPSSQVDECIQRKFKERDAIIASYANPANQATNRSASSASQLPEKPVVRPQYQVTKAAGKAIVIKGTDCGMNTFQYDSPEKSCRTFAELIEVDADSLRTKLQRCSLRSTSYIVTPEDGVDGVNAITCFASEASTSVTLRSIRRLDSGSIHKTLTYYSFRFNGNSCEVLNHGRRSNFLIVEKDGELLKVTYEGDIDRSSANSCEIFDSLPAARDAANCDRQKNRYCG